MTSGTAAERSGLHVRDPAAASPCATIHPRAFVDSLDEFVTGLDALLADTGNGEYELVEHSAARVELDRAWYGDTGRDGVDR